MLGARQSYYSSGDKPMIVSIDTTIVNVSPLGSMRITFLLPAPVNCKVDWGDGVIEVISTTGAKTHAYTTSGLYDIKIYGRAGFAFTDSKRVKDVKQWGTLKIANALSMFSGANTITTLSASDSPVFWGNVNASNMFTTCANFIGGNMNTWKTSNISNMAVLFYNSPNFSDNISTWDTSNVSNMRLMFGASNVFNQPIGNWNTSKVTDMSGMFIATKVFNQPIGNWDTSNVTTMSSMFDTSLAFNQPIGNWNVGKVTDMALMFTKANAFNQPIGNWNVSNVTNMSIMFGTNNGAVNGANSFNQDISSWNTSKVTNTSFMFQNAKKFNNGQAAGVAGSGMDRTVSSGWKTGNITLATNMSNMFYGASSFNQNLGNWCVSNTTAPSGFSVSTANWTQPKPTWGACPIPN